MEKKVEKALITLAILCAVVFITVGFSSFSKSLAFSDVLAEYRIPAELRITDFYMTGTNNNGSSSNNNYNYDRVITDIILPNQNSSVTYKVQITNLGNRVGFVEDITNLPSNITYELSGYTIGKELCNNNSCRNGVVKEFFITFKYKDNGYDSTNNPSGIYNLTAIFVLNYKVTIKYRANMFATESTTTGGINIDYDAQSSILTLNGSTSSSIDVASMYLDSLSFNEGETYIVDVSEINNTLSASNLPMHHLEIQNSSHQSLNPANASSSTSFLSLIVSSTGASNGSTLAYNYQVQPNTTFNNYSMKVTIEKLEEIYVSYNGNYVLPNYTPVRKGFVFDGWYTAETGGTLITSSSVVNTYNDITLYAHWTSTDTMTAPTISYESNYVSSGLQLLFDGRNNTGNGHNSNSTIWKNIKDNTNGTLHNNSWGSDYLAFNGSNSYVAANSDYYSSNTTLEAVFSLNSKNSRQQIIGNPNEGGIQLLIYPNNDICAGVYADGYWHAFCANYTVSTNNIYHVALTFDESNMKLYINGEFVNQSYVGNSITSPTSGTKMTLGCYSEYNGTCSNHFLDGKMYSARVYSRALSDSEINHNYLVDSLYVGRYVSLNPRVTISGGSSDLGVLGYEYSVNNNSWNNYNSSNKPIMAGPTSLAARVYNLYHSPGPSVTELVYIDNDPPTATVDANVVSGSLNVTVSASDPLSGVKNYGYLLSSTNTCNSSLTGFTVSNSNTYTFSSFNSSMRYVCVKVTDNADNSYYVSEYVPITLAVGDEIEIKGEHFYVVSSNETTTVLLAKYNLLVGNKDSYNTLNGNFTYLGAISPSDPGYGLQSSSARAYVETDNTTWTFIGEVPFSSTNYWDNSVCQYSNNNYSCTGSNGLLSEYATGGAHYNYEPYPYVYRSNMSSTAPSYYSSGYQYVQNNGYTIAYYVENYVDTLKSMGAPSTISGRLLSEEEMVALGCSTSSGTCNSAPSWVYNTSYWLGSASNQTQLWTIMSNGEIHDVYSWKDTHEVGVRVVIEMPTSDCHSIYDIEFVDRQNQNLVSVGDEVSIGSEHFYVVSSNQNETALLAKYNLFVGDIFDVDFTYGEHYTLVKTLSANDTGYGLQNSTAKGQIPLEENQTLARLIGTVGFSSTNYWDNSVCAITNGTYGCTGEIELYPEYSQNGEEYGSSPYPYVYRSNLGNNIGEDVDYASGFGGGFGVLRDNGYTIAYYVEQYINTLKSMGAPPTVTGRLLSHEEAVSLGCDGTFSWNNDVYCSSVDEENNPTSGNAPDWVYSSSYWLGSAAYYTSQYRISSTGRVTFDIPFLEGDTGVRPVIVIPTSTLN